MDLVTLVYLADVLPSLAGVFVVLAIASSVIGFFCLVFGGIEDAENVVQIGKIIVPIGIALGIVAALIPSKTTMYMMAGASIAQEIHKDERTKKVYEKLYQVIDEQLDKALKK